MEADSTLPNEEERLRGHVEGYLAKVERLDQRV